MEIQRWLCCIIVNCVLIPNLQAKSISLNEVIAAESQLKPTIDTVPESKFSGVARRDSFFQRLASKLRGRIARGSDTVTQRGKQIVAPLANRKTFKIPSPLKPKKLKLGQKLRRKNQSTKREIDGNEELKPKNFPLLKSLGMLFDNLLSSDGRDSYEFKTKKYKRNRYYTDDPVETTSYESDSRIPKLKFKPKKKTTPTQPLATQITPKTETFTLRQATTAPTYSSTTPNFSTIRQNKNIPVLLPRNTFSVYGNDNGISTRGGPTFHRNIQRDISRDHGDHKHHTGDEKYESITERYEKDAHSPARNDASGTEYGRTNGYGTISRHSELGNTNSKSNNSKDEVAHDTFRENQFENRRHEKQSEISIPESYRRLRGFPTENEISHNPESLQSKEVHEESNDSVPHNSSSYKRFTDGSSAITTKVQKVRTRNETMILIGNRLNVTNIDPKQTQNKAPVVMIYDGYSVTRNKNGENKLSEKSIRIHS